MEETDHKPYTMTIAGLDNLLMDDEIQPIVGQVYRDRFNRSLLVLSQYSNDVMVEYADGEVLRITHQKWKTLSPCTAVF
jgi:hypothetical protein